MGRDDGRAAQSPSGSSGARAGRGPGEGAVPYFSHISFRHYAPGGAAGGSWRRGARRGEIMRIAAVLLGAVLAALTATAAPAAVRIKADPGGQIGPYLEELE